MKKPKARGTRLAGVAALAALGTSVVCQPPAPEPSFEPSLSAHGLTIDWPAPAPDEWSPDRHHTASGIDWP
ncbi:hypothetical protein GL263_25415 [Streptomyces durbertensis]|uniref:Uncharacterized protein n=1 Tax=Streptomyces durbertensis TaxID=2448886 RepID=A0ABR6END6_9ACTN|nr:hypothetical protein [Streptomyces durbertensis]MBB1246864.1 hypothetical protein [Streptomyces durbertensis]